MKSILVVIGLSLFFSTSCGTSSDELFQNEESQALFQKAQDFQFEGRLDSALFYFNQADIAAPHTPVILHERGLLKSSMGDYDGALEDIDRSINMAPNAQQLEYWQRNREIVTAQRDGAIP